jgi:hypothetical protein
MTVGLAPCTVCGAERSSKQFQFMHECSRECFHKAFWNEKLEWADAGDRTPEGSYTVRIDGRHYVGNLEAGLVRNDGRQFLGFSGAVWYIQFLSGPHAPKLFITNNLWHQGDIPADVRSRMPDNAKFLKKEEYYQLTGESMDPRPFAP